MMATEVPAMVIARLIDDRLRLKATVRHAENAIDRADDSAGHAADGAADKRADRAGNAITGDRTLLRSTDNALSLRGNGHGESE